MKYNIVKPRLPMEYQEVEYIQGGGYGQYFDTKYYPNGNTSFETEIAIQPSVNSYVCGCWENVNNAFLITYFGANFYTRCGGQTNFNFSPIANDFVKTKCSLTQSSYGSQSQTLANTSSSTSISLSFLLFARNSEGSIQTSSYSFKMKEFVIRESGTKVRHFIPCFRKSDGVIGLYDLCGSICPLTGTPFYINSGTGAFTKGANKTELVKCDIATYDAQNNVIERYNIWHDLPRNYQRVEWIESHGTEYVDAGLKPTNDMGISVDYEYTTLNAPAGICGTFTPSGYFSPRQDALFATTQSGLVETSTQVMLFSRGREFQTGVYCNIGVKYKASINYLNDNLLKFGTNQQVNGTGDVYNLVNICLFRRYHATNHNWAYTKAKIYGSMLTKANAIIRKFQSE